MRGVHDVWYKLSDTSSCEKKNVIVKGLGLALVTPGSFVSVQRLAWVGEEAEKLHSKDPASLRVDS